MIEAGLQPKIFTAREGVAELSNFVKNPPRSPVAVVSYTAKILGANGSFTKSLGAFLPGAASALSALSGLLDAFSGGPSFEDMALDALQGLSRQIDTQLKNLERSIVSEISSAQITTVDAIINGVDEIARQQSATSVMSMLNEIADTEILIAEQKQIFEEFQQEIKNNQAEFLQDMQEKISGLSAAVNSIYEQYLKQVADLILEFLPELIETLEKALAMFDTPSPTPPESRNTLIKTSTGNSGSDQNNMLVYGLGGLALLALLATNKKR